MTNAVPRVGVAVLISFGSALLLGRRGKEPNYGKWVLPGGGVRFSESWRAAGEREVREETGLRVVVASSLPVAVEVLGPDEHRIILVVRAAFAGGTPCAASDLFEVAWFERDALPPDISPVAQKLLQALEEAP